MLFRSGGVSLEYSCLILLALKMNFSRTPMSRTLINIRNALYEGRTEATNTYYRVEEGEKIHYVDVISVYPYISKYGKFPAGHPKVYVGADCPNNCLDREGIVKFNVLPHRKVSSSNSVQKQLQTDVPLLFSLCRHYEPGRFTHSDEERCIVGTWIVDEVRKAVDMGYGLV